MPIVKHFHVGCHDHENGFIPFSMEGLKENCLGALLE